MTDLKYLQQPALIDVMKDVNAELTRAIAKFPTWPTDPIHAAQIVLEEAGELGQACLQACYEPNKATRQDMRDEAIQTAAMAIRFLMSIHNYVINPGQQHYQARELLPAPRAQDWGDE